MFLDKLFDKFFDKGEYENRNQPQPAATNRNQPCCVIPSIKTATTLIQLPQPPLSNYRNLVAVFIPSIKTATTLI